MALVLHPRLLKALNKLAEIERTRDKVRTSLVAALGREYNERHHLYDALVAPYDEAISRQEAYIKQLHRDLQPVPGKRVKFLGGRGVVKGDEGTVAHVAQDKVIVRKKSGEYVALKRDYLEVQVA